jgi:hypothetical protein
MGYVRVGSRPGLACDQPLSVLCRICEGRQAWRCDSYGCGPCGETKRRRLERLIEDGSGQHLERGRYGYFLTITAPGTADHLLTYQGRRPAYRPRCECHQHGMTNGGWNRQESACWNRLRTALTRDREVTFAGAVETQKRGLLHRHVVLFTDRVLTQPEVQALAVAAGYGCMVDVEPLDSARKAARYLAKYVTKSSTGRAEVPWSVELLDQETGELTEKHLPATYRLWSSSRAWGVTMKGIRQVTREQAARRAAQVAEAASAADLTTGTCSGSLLRSCAPDNGDP